MLFRNVVDGRAVDATDGRTHVRLEPIAVGGDRNTGRDLEDHTGVKPVMSWIGAR